VLRDKTTAHVFYRGNKI